MSNLYSEILRTHPEDWASDDYYSVPLKLKSVIKIYRILQLEGDEELCNSIASFLDDEYDIDLNFLTSIYYAHK